MHSFGQIASGHVSPLFITKILQKKRKERSKKLKMSQHKWKHIQKWIANKT